MKNIITTTITIALAALSIQTQAMADSSIIPPYLGVKTASLVDFEMDKDYSIHESDIESAKVTINQIKKTVTLEIQEFNTCRQTYCIQVIKGERIELPLVSQVTAFDGTVIYTALADRRPVDGNLVRLTVYDFSKSRLELKRRFMTRVVHDELTVSRSLHGAMQIRNVLQGGTLRSPVAPRPIITQ